MAQLNSLQRYGESQRSPLSPSTDQLLVGEASMWSPRNSPTSGRDHHHYLEDHHDHHHKKSVLTRVKEKAKKLRHSLSNKKKQTEDDGNTTPLSCVSSTEMEDDVGLDEEEVEEEDAEYLGAPMYESEAAPEGYKENAKKHPRAIPVVSEKHVLVSRQENEKHNPPSPNNKTLAETITEKLSPAYAKVSDTVTEKLSPTYAKVSDTVTEKVSPAYATVSDTVTDKLSPAYAKVSDTVTEKLSPAYATVSDTVTEKLSPAYVTVSDATHVIASKIQGLTISTQNGTKTDKNMTANEADTYTSDVKVDDQTSPRGQIWDKGVSVKEYIKNKFEPGEDEKALSEVIMNAISPRKSPREGGMVEKVKEAVSSLLWHEEPPEIQSSVTYPATNLSSPHPLPVSTHAYEVEDEVEEENHGRILQAN